MFWYILATAFPSFVLGFAVCNLLYSKKIRQLELARMIETSKRDYENWNETFKLGWDAASNDAGHIWEQYKKLFPKKDTQE